MRLGNILDRNNVLVKSFRMVRDRLNDCVSSDLKLRLVCRRSTDPRTYNLPLVSEVAALVVGDVDQCQNRLDIIVETRSGRLKRISELHPSYLPLQYPLLFPYGEDGYREDIPFAESEKKYRRKKISFMEFFAFRLHERAGEVSILLFSRRLLQQFIVDSYTVMESARLCFVRRKQPKLRAHLYSGINEGAMRGRMDAAQYGKPVVLPSSFTGSPRYMRENYQDAMAICAWIGYPDLFITFTCNPKWPEIVRFAAVRNLKTYDRPDIVSRIFKMKLNGLMNDLRKKELFGPVRAGIYLHILILPSLVLLYSNSFLYLFQLFTRLNFRNVDYPMHIFCFFCQNSLRIELMLPLMIL